MTVLRAVAFAFALFCMVIGAWNVGMWLAKRIIWFLDGWFGARP